MSSLEKIAANIEMTAWKRNRLRKAILRLALEWNDFEECLESSQGLWRDSLRQLESRSEHLELIRNSATENNGELESIGKSIEDRLGELERRERGFYLFQRDQIEEFRLKEQQLESLRGSIEEATAEMALSDEKFDAQRKTMEGLFEKFEWEHRQFEPIQRSIEECLRELDLKEKEFKSRCKELSLIQNWIERRADELDTKEEHLEEWYKQLDSKEKRLDSTRKLHDEHSEKLDSKKKQLESVQAFLSKCFKDFLLKKKQLKLEERLLEERSKKLELKEKQLDYFSNQLELKEKQLANALHSHIEQCEKMSSDDAMNCSYADIRFCISMDGKSLQMFLNERTTQHDLMSDEICFALKLSLDPAKLVLNAMEGFYPPHLKKGDVEFEEHAVRRSCIVLLEQLMRISPLIQPHVREEALKLAYDWKMKMGVVAQNSLEVLGFLQLLASYKLASAFDANELHSLLDIVAEHKVVPKLCQALGFADKIPDFVLKFIKMKQYLVATRYIFAFELVDKFPPVPLLRKYLTHCRKLSQQLQNKGNNAYHAKNVALGQTVAAVRALIRSIGDHELDRKYLISNIEMCIEKFEILKDGEESAMQAPANVDKTKEKRDKKLASSAVASTPPTKVLDTMLMHPKIPVNSLVSATTLAHILSKMDGKRLQIFLNDHLEEHELMRSDVSTALQISVDSAKLVLDGVQGFYPPHLQKGDMDFEASLCKRSCIFLLEQLMRISPQIKPEVKEEAMKLAVDWKGQMKSEMENPLNILGFLQIVGAFRLASAFDAVELLNLFVTVEDFRHAPELCLALGFSDKIVGNSMLQSQVKVSQSLSESLLLNYPVTSSSVGQQEDFKSLCTNIDTKNSHHSVSSVVPSSIQFACDPAKLVLDAMQCCYQSNQEEKGKSKLDVLKIFVLFLEQLMRVSPEIKPHVQEEAMSFAVYWKAAEMLKIQNPSTVLIFLQLLANYKLASSFNADDLLGLFDIVLLHKQTIHLFRALDLEDKLPDFIQNLIKKGMQIEAIRYIYAFGLDDKFSPVSLLKEYLTGLKADTKRIHKERFNSLKAERKAINKLVAGLRVAISCIKRYRLETEFSMKSLETRIEVLQRKLANLKSAMPLPKQKQNWRKRNSPDIASAAQSQPQPAKKHCWTAASEAAAPVCSTQRPSPCLTGLFEEQSAPNLKEVAKCHDWSGSPPVIPHTGHFQQHCGSDTHADRSVMLVDSAGYQFGSAADFHTQPLFSGGTHHPAIVTLGYTAVTHD